MLKLKIEDIEIFNKDLNDLGYTFVETVKCHEDNCQYVDIIRKNVFNGIDPDIHWDNVLDEFILSFSSNGVKANVYRFDKYIVKYNKITTLLKEIVKRRVFN